MILLKTLYFDITKMSDREYFLNSASTRSDNQLKSLKEKYEGELKTINLKLFAINEVLEFRKSERKRKEKEIKEKEFQKHYYKDMEILRLKSRLKKMEIEREERRKRVLPNI